MNFYWLEMVGTAAFAITAVLAVTSRGIDLFGVAVLAIITAIGGGTLRDLILGVPVFWSNDLDYIWVALGAGIIAFVTQHHFTWKILHKLVLYFDGLGAALFSVYAADKVWGLEFGLPLAPVILGIVTGIGGGLIRDMLSGRPTLLVTRELYAIPIMIGCVFYVLIMSYFPTYREPALLGCILFSFALRSAAITWNLEIPHWLTSENKTNS